MTKIVLEVPENDDCQFGIQELLMVKRGTHGGRRHRWCRLCIDRKRSYNEVENENKNALLNWLN